MYVYVSYPIQRHRNKTYHEMSVKYIYSCFPKGIGFSKQFNCVWQSIQVTFKFKSVKKCDLCMENELAVKHVLVFVEFYSHSTVIINANKQEKITVGCNSDVLWDNSCDSTEWKGIEVDNAWCFIADLRIYYATDSPKVFEIGIPPFKCSIY